MPIPTSCPHCQHAISLPDQLRGRKVRCARCQQVFVASATSRSAAPSRSSQSSAKAGVSHMTLILGMAIAFLLAVIVVGAGVFFLVLQERTPPASSPVASRPETKSTPTVPEKKTMAVVEEPPAKPPPPVIQEKEAPPKETPPPVVVSGDGSLAPEVLQRVKRSTVYLRVTLPSGAVSQGSGFLGVEPDTIITNAHVLQMMRPLNPSPKQIEVVFNSGQSDERNLPGQLVGLDRDADLAILKLTADQLPEPLPVLTAKDLIETQQVFVCGFPLGQRLGKEITIGNSRVASLRREGGVLTRIQLSGEMNPGNSGGPIIDTRGQVIGVAVSGVATTTINFAIPGENVHALLNGRLDKASFGQAYQDGAQVKVPATVRLLDPLKRVQKVAVEIWTGETGAARPPAVAAPKPLANDSPRQPAPLAYQDGTAKGDIVLPPLPAGRVYWVQLVTTPASGAARWSQAKMLTTMPPLERQAITLPAAHTVGVQPLELTSNLVLNRDRGNSGEDVLALGFQASLQERVVSAGNPAALRFQYEKMEARITLNGQAPQTNPFQQVAPLVNLLGADMRVDRQGVIALNQVDTAKVPANARPLLNTIGEQIQQLLQALTLPLAAGTVQPGQSWSFQRTLPIDVGGKYDSAIIDSRCTYLGVRQRDGKREAVLELSGEVKARPGAQAEAAGLNRGIAIVELSTGLVTSVEVSVEADLDVPAANGQFKASGTLDMKLLRGRGK